MLLHQRDGLVWGETGAALESGHGHPCDGLLESTLAPFWGSEVFLLARLQECSGVFLANPRGFKAGLFGCEGPLPMDDVPRIVLPSVRTGLLAGKISPGGYPEASQIKKVRSRFCLGRMV